MKTIFTKAIGNTPKIKVLEFLIEGRELDYSISDIAEGAGIGRTTLFRIWDDFVESEIVIKAVRMGYKLAQIPVRYKRRMRENSQVSLVKDGLRFARSIIYFGLIVPPPKRQI